MKGQGEVVETIAIIGMIVIFVVITRAILPVITKTIGSFISDYPEIISKDLASLISVAAAATDNIRITYSFPSDTYSVSFSDRYIFVSRKFEDELQESYAPILINARGNIPKTSHFTIEKKVEGGGVSYYVNDVCIYGTCLYVPPPGVPGVPWPGVPTGVSKLGIQTQFTEQHVIDFIDEAKPVVVKLMDRYYMAEEIKERSPTSFIIGRIIESNQPTDGNPEQRAQEWFNRNFGIISNPGFDCWEGYNEPTIESQEEMEWFSRFEIERMKLLESMGRKACIGSFAVGNPDLPLWSSFMGALDYASTNGHYLALHEYGNPTMQSDSEWLSLRHRKVYDQYGLTLPLVITETGIDTGCGEDCGGWRSQTDADNFLNQLRWYDSELQKDDYVIGAAIYHYAIMGWESFEIYPELVGSDGRSGPLTTYIRDSYGYV